MPWRNNGCPETLSSLLPNVTTSVNSNTESASEEIVNSSEDASILPYKSAKNSPSVITKLFPRATWSGKHNRNRNQVAGDSTLNKLATSIPSLKYEVDDYLNICNDFPTLEEKTFHIKLGQSDTTLYPSDSDCLFPLELFESEVHSLFPSSSALFDPSTLSGLFEAPEFETASSDKSSSRCTLNRSYMNQPTPRTRVHSFLSHPICSFDEDGTSPIAIQPATSPLPYQRGTFFPHSSQGSLRHKAKQMSFCDLLFSYDDDALKPDIRISGSRVIESFVIHKRSVEGSEKLTARDIENLQGKINQYFMLQDIGCGAFGRVRLCLNEGTDRYYASKVVSKSKLKKKFRWSRCKSPRLLGTTPGADQGSVDNVKKEIAILKKLSKHPNINALVEVIDDQNEDNLYMFFELCELGPVMLIRVNEAVRPFSEALSRRYFRDVLLGMEYLHKNRIVHRDLKPENLLLTIHHTIQIADFSISHMFEEGEDDKLFDKNTSPLFCPPEACNENEQSQMAIKGFPFDVWSMGVTLYCFVHGYCPFEDECIPDLYAKICYDEPIVSTDLSSELRNLILGMLAKNPDVRPTIKQIRNDAWVLNNGKDPLISEDQNCVTEPVTDEEIRDAVAPGKAVLKRIKDMICRSMSKLNLSTSM